MVFTVEDIHKYTFVRSTFVRTKVRVIPSFVPSFVRRYLRTFEGEGTFLQVMDTNEARYISHIVRRNFRSLRI